MLKWKSYSGREQVNRVLRKDVHRFWRVKWPPRSSCRMTGEEEGEKQEGGGGRTGEGGGGVDVR